MSNTSQPAKNKKSSANVAVIAVVILAILFFIAYKITKPQAPVSEPLSVQTQTDTITPASESDNKAVSQIDKEDSESATADKTASKTANNDELQSINTFLDNWKIAWQKSADEKGDLKKYFSFYGDDFKPAKQSKDAWQRSKSIRNHGKTWIEVWLTNITITKGNDGNYIAKFKQEYSSSNYSDKSMKKLTLRKTNDSWSIIKEETL